MLDVVLSVAVQDGDVLAVTGGLTLTLWRTSGELQLLDLHGPWAQLIRAGTHLSTAPHTRTQPWARAIRLHYPPPPRGAVRARHRGPRDGRRPQRGQRTHLAGRIELSRPLRHPQLLPIIGTVGRRLGFAIELV